jgi:hypothetical protein
MNQWNVKTYSDYLVQYNPYGLDFFNRKDLFLQSLSKILTIGIDDLYNPREGIYMINEELCSKSVYLDEPKRQRHITQKIASELFYYLIFFDECKHTHYKMKTKRAYIKTELGYCPTLLNSKGHAQLGTLSFCNYNLNGLIENNYWDIPSSYGNPRNRLYNKSYIEVDIGSYEIVIAE